MKLGIVSPADVAYRRFMPSLCKIPEIEFAGVGIYTEEERFGNDKALDRNVIEQALIQEEAKAQKFVDNFGGDLYRGYEEISKSREIDALYIPLPPALHYTWARCALESGKHVLLEKPATLSYSETEALVNLARRNNLALHEDYMFVFHDQLAAIDEIIQSGEIGEVRLYRISFGFPLREKNDFRYKKILGGGALYDACGYTIKYASRLLGASARIQSAQINYIDGFEVDMFGSGTLVNDEGLVAQISYGMDNNYKCELEVWGSKGCITTGRVLTAPTGFTPTVTIRKGNEYEVRNLPADDAFKKSIEYFVKCISNKETREENYKNILKQALLVEQFKELARA